MKPQESILPHVTSYVLTTGLVFSKDDDALTKEGIIRTWTTTPWWNGGIYSSGAEARHEHNPESGNVGFWSGTQPRVIRDL